MRTAAAITRDVLVIAIWIAVMLATAALLTVGLDGFYDSLGASPLMTTVTTMTLAILSATAVSALCWKGVERARSWSSSRGARSRSQTDATFANIA